MGRKSEFKAAKSFTICMSELSWLAEYSERTKQKASVVVNKLLREAMIKDKTDYPKFLSMLDLHEKAEYRLWLKWLKELPDVQMLSDEAIKEHLDKKHKQWDANRQTDFDYR